MNNAPSPVASVKINQFDKEFLPKQCLSQLEHSVSVLVTDDLNSELSKELMDSHHTEAFIEAIKETKMQWMFNSNKDLKFKKCLIVYCSESDSTEQIDEIRDLAVGVTGELFKYKDKQIDFILSIKNKPLTAYFPNAIILRNFEYVNKGKAKGSEKGYDNPLLNELVFHLH
jgi:hypothetical protein